MDTVSISPKPADQKMRKFHCGASLQTPLSALVIVEPFFLCACGSTPWVLFNECTFPAF